MFKFFKLIIIGIIALVVMLGVSLAMNFGVSKDSILSNYDSILRFFGEDSLTSNSRLKGKREYGVDHYCRNI